MWVQGAVLAVGGQYPSVGPGAVLAVRGQYPSVGPGGCTGSQEPVLQCGSRGVYWQSEVSTSAWVLGLY